MKASVAGFARAQSLPELYEMLKAAGPDGQVIAGGQSLVASLNLRLSEGMKLVDIRGIAELKGITVSDGKLCIGALTCHAELGRSPLVAQHAPLLAQAVPLIAHAAIRTRGTIGGSLANADPAAELPACVLALGGEIVAQGVNGTRRITSANFAQGLFLTALDEGEIITAVEIPVATADDAQSIRELTRRSGDYALVGLAAVRRGSDFRLAYFGVSDTPVLARSAMAVLSGGGSRAEAIAALHDDLDPQGDLHASASYRRHLAGVLLGRVMNDLTGHEPQQETV